MVSYPNFKIEANGVDVTESLKANLIDINFKDEANNQSDTLTLKVAGAIARPAYKDELKLYLGYGDELVFMGLFIVQSSVRENNNILTINVTSVDFSQSLKEKRDNTYENVSVADICKEVADRNNLQCKSDFDDVFYEVKVQHNESDMHFLNRLSKELNAIFNIKNNTLIFTKKIKDDEKNSELPHYTISANDVENISLKYSNRTLYKSVKAIYRDTKENTDKEVVIGDGNPMLVIKDSFSSDDEAKSVATAKLQKANSGIVSGTINMAGRVVYAGGVLKLVDALEDDGEYQIKSVTHSLNESGYKITIEFEN